MSFQYTAIDTVDAKITCAVRTTGIFKVVSMGGQGLCSVCWLLSVFKLWQHIRSEHTMQKITKYQSGQWQLPGHV